ncbi:hypothetical protein [Zunongwangia sp.]|uniref:hypothetical protein n=1 Tax=Zunongwangia sp. TaxID=1965325 RepID=UPI003AA8765E
MIKYEIKRSKQSVGNFIPVGYDFKTIKKSELDSHLNNGWSFIRKKYFIITSILDWWKTLKNGEKIAFFAIIVSAFVYSFFWLVDNHLDNKYQNLNDKYNSLNADYNRLQQTLILTSDSLNKEREKIETISKPLQSKTSSDKNQADKKNISD